jgi:hypothetical protein
VPGRRGVGARHGPGDGVVVAWAPGVWRRGGVGSRRVATWAPVNHLGPFGDVLVINDNCLWTNGSWRNKNAGLDHIEQQMLENHKHWLWIR